jgi:cell division transport system ATP-binding protein
MDLHGSAASEARFAAYVEALTFNAHAAVMGLCGRLDGLAGSVSRSRAPTGPRRRRRLPRAETTVVRLEQIGKRYSTGPEVLHDISLELAPGDFCFVTGASGAGKTTLLKIIYLAEPASRGVLTLFEQNAAAIDRPGRAALRRRIGIVFQEFRLLDHLSLRDNVALPLRLAGVSEAEIRSHVAELVGWLGLEHKIEARPPTLSSGERQLAAIARALVRRPELLIADEPTGNVDDEVAQQLVRVFERINRLGATVLIATHDIAFARRFAHRRLHLEQGGLVPAGGDATQ